MDRGLGCKAVVRVSDPCDTCVLRRVKCGTERPCRECCKRGLECTSLRARKKRGPKGPRASTRVKVQARYNKITVQPAARQTSPATESVCGGHQGSLQVSSPRLRDGMWEAVTPIRRLPFSAYCKFIEIFRARLYPIWPVVFPSNLLSEMTTEPADNESYALAAALCAATISQLRLDEHSDCKDGVSSLAFALDAERARANYDYREVCGLSSLLTAFFLHMYYSNANKLRTAAVLLREAVTYAQIMGLDQSHTLQALGSHERSRRLRIYWLLLISEKTFAAENGISTILEPIEAKPTLEDDLMGADLRAFIALTHLFSFLRPRDLATVANQRSETEGQEISSVQEKLASARDDAALNETQRVDLCVTRQWIRVLTWEHTTRHFAMSSHTANAAFSLLLPIQIGREILSFFTMVDSAYICAHGYGMELKVFKMADTVLDIISCLPDSRGGGGMALGAGDVLLSLRNIISMVGGPHSKFVGRLHRRLLAMAAPPADCDSVLQPGFEDWDQQRQKGDQFAHRGYQGV